MRFPTFTPSQRLSEWPGCILEIRCPSCSYHVSYAPLRMLIATLGDATFADLLRRLTCKVCGTRPAPVYLVAGFHREFCGGGRPDWALELVPKSKNGPIVPMENPISPEAVPKPICKVVG